MSQVRVFISTRSGVCFWNQSTYTIVHWFSKLRVHQNHTGDLLDILLGRILRVCDSVCSGLSPPICISQTLLGDVSAVIWRPHVEDTFLVVCSFGLSMNVFRLLFPASALSFPPFVYGSGFQTWVLKTSDDSATR